MTSLRTRVHDWHGGAFALVVGNSFGVGPSVSLTTVAGRRERDGFWQLSEPTMPGSSGAPVFDSDGALGGIVVGEVAGSRGGSYERPLPAVMVTSQQLKQVIDRLASLSAGQGAPWLGISVRSFVESGGRASLYVSNVFSNSPAAHAGFQPGDVLLSVDTLTVSYVADLAQWIRQCRPGSAVSVHVLRHGERQTLTVTVGER
jgi:serine protease DegS